MKRILVPGLTLVLSMVSAAPAPGGPAAGRAGGPRLLGAWRNVKAKGRILCFQKDRCIVRERGRSRFYLARYRADRVEVWVAGQFVPWTFTLRGKTLVLDRGTGKRAFERLAKPPADLEPRPLKLGRRRPVGARRKAEIRAELLRRKALDQAVRTDRRRMAEMGRVDRDNTAWLKKLVAEVGWINARRFGRAAADAAFLLVQHSGDVPLMLAAMPAIHKDFAGGLVDGQSYCLLFDRLQMRLGHKQRYGSQVVPNRRGEMVVYPLEHPSKVDALRKKAGLMPLDRYLALIERTYGKKVKR